MGKVRLTKEQAIKGHREMWNWIAEQYENGRTVNVNYLKEKWCKKHNIYLYNNCYCCEYVSKNNTSFYKCGKCPLIWGTENNVNEYYCESGINHKYYGNTGLWFIALQYSKNGRYKEAAEICRKIANLEVKEDV